MIPLWGYVVGDFDFDKLMHDAHPSTSILVRGSCMSLLDRDIVGFVGEYRMIDVSTGRLAPLPITPSLRSCANQIASVVHRYGCDMPLGDAVLQQRFLEFGKKLILKLFPPMPETFAPEHMLTFDQWLDQTSYSGSRRKALRRLRASIDSHSCRPPRLKEMVNSEAFIKREGWSEPKYARAINSPSDMTKVLLGNWIHAVDKATFASGYFVKGSDPKTWPEKLRDLFGRLGVAETDFTSMEAHHQGVFLKVVHFWMMHMLRGYSCPPALKRLVSRMMLGTNTSEFSTLTATVDEKLMSGVLWTSSSNGLLNLIIMMFLQTFVSIDESIEAQLDRTDDVDVLVEGDDGITACEEEEAAKMKVTAERLGLRLKPVWHPSFDEAKFCSLICDPSELVVLPDPAKVLRNFFLLPPKFRDSKKSVAAALIRAKAMSYAYLYHDAPIVGALAHRVCFLTKAIDHVSALSETDSWKIQFIEKAHKERDTWLKKPPQPSDTSRAIVAERFKISVLEQITMEAQIMKSGPVFEVMTDFLRGPYDDKHQDEYLGEVPKAGLGSFVPEPVMEIWRKRRLEGASKASVLKASRRSNWIGDPVDPYFEPRGQKDTAKQTPLK